MVVRLRDAGPGRDRDGAARLLPARARDHALLHGRRPVHDREQVRPVGLPLHRLQELQGHPHEQRLPARRRVLADLDVRERVLPLHARPRPRRDAEPADPVPRRLPDAADGSLGGAVVHLGLRLALHLQQPVRVPRPVPGQARVARSAGVPRRSDLGEVRGDHDQRLAGRPVHDGRPPRRPPGDRQRPARRRVGRRRQHLAALLGRHDARACAPSRRR